MKVPYKLPLALALLLFPISDTSVAQSTGNSPVPAPVSLTVTVTDKRTDVVSGLHQTAFTISDNTGVREITSFSNEDAPMSIAVVIDLSGSMYDGKDRKRIKSVVDALSHFVRRSHPSNEYFLIGVNRTPNILLDGARDANAVLSSLQDIASIELKGPTALYDACVASINKLEHGGYPKKVILLISDGEDNRSKNSLDVVRRLLKETTTLVYSIDVMPGRDGLRGYQFNEDGSDILEEIASPTGGATYGASNALEMRATFELIALELRQQYAISFLPANNTSSGKWHPLKIKVSIPPNNSQRVQKVSVRARKGYYSN